MSNEWFSYNCCIFIGDRRTTYAKIMLNVVDEVCLECLVSPICIHRENGKVMLIRTPCIEIHDRFKDHVDDLRVKRGNFYRVLYDKKSRNTYPL